MNPEEIFETYYDKIYSFTLLRVGNVHDAEDIACNVFLKVVEKLHTYNSSIAAFSTWIFTITLNEIRMYYRRRKPVCSLDDINELANQLDIEENILRHEERTTLLKALDKLDEKRKSIILLKYFADFSDRQIAEALGLSEKNVGVILSRTKKALRDTLIRYSDSSFPAHKDAGNVKAI